MPRSHRERLGPESPFRPLDPRIPPPPNGASADNKAANIKENGISAIIFVVENFDHFFPKKKTNLL